MSQVITPLTSEEARGQALADKPPAALCLTGPGARCATRLGAPCLCWTDVLQGVSERRWLAALVLLAWCGLLFFYGLASGDLYRTESLRAIIAAEFLRSGNWAVPTLYGQPLLTKPPGMYAAIALLSWPFGQVSNWTARLPSALAAMATVLLVYWYAGRQLGRLGGLVAALILPASFMWLERVPSAEIDMLQVAWVSASILFFLRALEESERQTRNLKPETGTFIWWLAALLCVAGGLLTKWTAPVFFYGTVVPLLWWRGRLRLLFCRQHVVSAAVAGSICLAWAGVVVSRAGWHPFSATVTQEALAHLLPGYHARAYSWWRTAAHPLLLVAAAGPWSLGALLAFKPSFARMWDERGRRLLQALHCWIWPNLVFWSLVPGHALRHSFPLCPALAGLAAMVWIAWLDGRLHCPFPPRRVLIGILAVWVVVKLIFVHAVIPARSEGREPRAKAAQVAALVPQGRTLYLFGLKDEGIMFYYGRRVRRLPSPAQLPSSGEPLYCILNAAEWERRPRSAKVEALLRLTDEQGAEIVLVRVVTQGKLDW